MASDSEDDQELSGSSDNDEAFDEDIEALRRACIITGTNPNDLQPPSATGDDSDSDEIDDLELVRSIQQRFSAASDVNQPLSLKPLSSLPPALSDDEEDDFETLRAIQRRFSQFESDTLKNSIENYLQKPEQVCATSIASEKETSNKLFVNGTNACEGFPDTEYACNSTQNSESFRHNVPGFQPPGLIEWHQSGSPSFPKSAQVFIDAIKKNRFCQKFLRSKVIQIEARIEENKKLRERLKILKDFQVSCRKRTGRALSQHKDARVQLISVPKLTASNNSKVNDKKISAMYCGPAENSHVANYRMALMKFPLSLSRKKWSEAEKENLVKGIKQQFQELLLQKKVDSFSGPDGSSGDSNDFDNIIASIKDLEITPENIRLFLPKVNWERLASMYVMGRSGAECETRWLNCEDPLINHNPWTNTEDKNLLLVVQQTGVNNWIDIAVSLGTNRTPFQCLARYQRSLNPSIMKREWTKDEDAQLRKAVEAFGESNWQLVASNLEGRTGTQCSNRWKKTLHPARQRVGRWSTDEDKRLKVAVMLFGPKTWRKIAQFVPGRTQVQCRERWVNCLDPSLNWNKWTGEEDLSLEAAIAKHGYCWSKVAAHVPPRTDSQCLRRWKVLRPHEVPLLQAARKIQKAALISNFVDRESERPSLGPNDFLPLQVINSISEPENVNPSGKRKRKPRGSQESKGKDTASWDARKKIRSKRSRREAHICSEEVPGITNSDEFGIGGDDAILKKKKRITKPLSKNNKCTEPTQDHSLSYPDSTLLMITNGKEVEAFGGDAAKKKKKPLRMHSRRNKCTDSPEDSQGLLLPPESLDLGTINGDGIETFGGDNTTSYKKKRAPEWHPKPRSKKSKCTVPTTQDANCEEVEAFGGDDATKKKAPKLRSRTNKCTEPPEDSHSFLLHPESLELGTINDDGILAFDGNNTTSSKKKRALKQHPRRKRITEQSGEQQDSTLPSRNCVILGTTRGTEPTQDHSSPHLDSTLLIIANGEEVDTFNGDDTTTKKKRCMEPAEDSHGSALGAESSELRITNYSGAENFCRDSTTSTKMTPKQHPRRNKCNESSGECLDFTLPPEKSTLLRTTNGDGLETLVGDVTTSKKKKLPELHSENNGNAQTAQDHQDLSLSLQHSIVIRILNGDDFGNVDVENNTISKKREVAKLYSKEGKSTEIAEGPKNISLPPMQSSFDISDTSLNENSRASGVWQKNRPQKTGTRNKSCPKQISGTTDGDDTTLACFLRNRLKNRRHELAKKGSPACSPGSIMKGSELLPDGNRVLSSMQGCEAQSCSNGDMPKNLSSHNQQSIHSEDMPPS